METSKLFKLAQNDYVKGLAIAILTAVLTVLYSAIKESGLVGIDWGLVTQTTILATISYMLKQIGTNSDGKLLAGEHKE